MTWSYEPSEGGGYVMQKAYGPNVLLSYSVWANRRARIREPAIRRPLMVW